MKISGTPSPILLASDATAALAQDDCRQGFFWREAFAGSYVCVTQETRARVAEDNRQAGSRLDPGKRRLVSPLHGSTASRIKDG